MPNFYIRLSLKFLQLLCNNTRVSIWISYRKNQNLHYYKLKLLILLKIYANLYSLIEIFIIVSKFSSFNSIGFEIAYFKKDFLINFTLACFKCMLCYIL